MANKYFLSPMPANVPGSANPGSVLRISSPVAGVNDTYLRKDINTGQWIDAQGRARTQDGQLFGQTAGTGNANGTQQIDPNNPAQRYSFVSLPKSPALAAAADKVSGQLGDVLAATSFSDLIGQFKQGGDAVKNAFAQTQVANDTAPFENASNLAVGNLRRIQGDYSNTLSDIQRQYGESDADYAARVRAGEQQGTDLLAGYDTAQNRARQLALDTAQRNFNLNGLSQEGGADSGMLAAAAREAANATLPYELAKINKQYDVLGQNLGYERELVGRDTSRIAGFGSQVAGNKYSSASDVERYGADTARQIAQLKQATASMSLSQAREYLLSLAIPYQIAQDILSKNIQNLGAAGQARAAGYDETFQDRLGWNTAQPQWFGMPQAQRTSAPNYQQPNYAQPGSPAPYGDVSGRYAPGGFTDVGGGYKRDQNGNTYTTGGQFVSAGVRQTALPNTTTRYMPQSPEARLAGQEDRYYEDQLRDDSYYYE